jgi:hypothetical protein
LTERERKAGTRKRIQATLRDKVGRKSGAMVGTNWRSRPLCEPLPFDQVFKHRQMSPASSEGIVPSRDYDQEARRRAVSTRGHDKQVARIESTNREAESRPKVRGYEPSGRTQSVRNR